MKLKLVITVDGSSTFYIETLNEHYHSVHGALQESLHVFINAGLIQKLNRQHTVEILEIGFGTGLNALLTCIEADKNKVQVNYTAVEKFPLTPAQSAQLNYGSIADTDNGKPMWDAIHQSSWEEFYSITEFFRLKKCNMNIEDIVFKNKFDIIYFDAFAPSAQPELWTEDIFTAMYNALKRNGILVTYCAKGVVKRTMKQVGFMVEALPGPKGKREMTRCIKL